MAELRDYDAWHHQYDDPESGLSWRLRMVQSWIRRALDERPGSFRIVSVCAGDGRDVLGVLAERAAVDREDADRVETDLIEIDDVIASRAEETARQLGLNGVRIRRQDAGHSETYADLEPADLVLLVGIFGNISDADIARTVAWSPALCAPGATLLWSRGRDRGDLNPQIRSWFMAAGFSELDYAERDSGSLPALGALRFDGTGSPIVAGGRLFSFIR